MNIKELINKQIIKSVITKTILFSLIALTTYFIDDFSAEVYDIFHPIWFPIHTTLNSLKLSSLMTLIVFLLTSFWIGYKNNAYLKTFSGISLTLTFLSPFVIIICLSLRSGLQAGAWGASSAWG